MNSLDSPLEALVFDSTSLTFFVSNIWTWIAVLTAAVSFWRLRSSGSSQIKSDPPPAQSRNTTATTIGGESRSPTTSSCSPLSCPVDSTASIPPSGFGSEACGPSNSGSNGYDGVTKGKFTFAYYSDEEEVEEREDDDGLVEVEWDEGVVRGCWSDQETKVMDVMTGLRMEDMGWYKYQDLKVLDGSVVRLWEKGRERNLLLQ
ncbi:hypothetical protein Ancab_027638 [Ancistrocladus abbreviatus]